MHFEKLRLSIEELAWNTGSCLALTITKPFFFKKNLANISNVLVFQSIRKYLKCQLGF